MSMNTLIWIGAAVAVVGAVLFRCKAEILAPLCEVWPEGGGGPLDDIISEFNKLPTLLDNPKTNQYRTVTMDKEDPRVVSKRIQDQSDFSVPKTATAVKQYIAATNKNAGTPAGGTSGPNGTGYNCNSTLCKLYPTNCPGCKKANYANSLFTTMRLAI